MRIVDYQRQFETIKTDASLTLEEKRQALETTADDIRHGLWFPHKKQEAQELEQGVRDYLATLPEFVTAR